MQHRRPVRSIAAASAALVSLAVLSACGADDDGDSGGGGAATDPGTESSATAGSADEGAGDLPADAPEVRVLDAGSDPRSTMLLDLEEGRVERTTMRMTTETVIDGQSVGAIPMQMDLVSTVETVGADEIVVAARYENVTAELPAGSRDAEEVLGAIEDVSMTQRIAPNGASLSSEIDVPEDASGMFASIVDQIGSQTTSLTVPFPSEPVGEGAAWEVETDLEISGVQMTQVATYTLTEFDGEEYAIDLELEQTIEPGTVSGAEIVGGKNVGSSTFEGSLQGLMAATGSSTVDGTMQLRSGDQEIESSTRVTTDLTTTVD